MKKIYINLSGSLVNTTAILGYVFAILSLVMPIAMAFKNVDLVFSVSVFLFCFTAFLSLIIISKVLEHLYYIRKVLEARAEDDGFEIKVETSN